MMSLPAKPLARRQLVFRPLVPTGSGFTLVEMVVVIMLIGIVAAIGMARFSDTKGFDAVAYADRVTGMLRYGQKLAIAQNRAVWVVADGAKVALCFDITCASSSQVLSPSGSNSGRTSTQAQCVASTWECEAPPTGISFTSSISKFYFDALGKPFVASDALGSATSTFATLTIRITGDGSNHDVVVERETGYVH